MGSGSDDVLEHHDDADERGRLDTPLGVVEFERTIGILAEHFPQPPAVVADVGGGPGRCHRPAQLRAEVRAAGLNVLDLVSVEGIAFALSDLEARLADPRGRAMVLDAARELAAVPELLGVGPHLLATARRPDQRS